MDPETFDHESHMRHAIELAHEAVARGDEPYGSVLVKDDEIVLTASNRVNTANDLRTHPELTLAKRAAAEHDDTAELVLYTSTEPCPMCSGGIDFAGLRTVVYSVSEKRAAELHDTNPRLPSTDVFEASGVDVTVIPDVLQSEGEKLHESR